MSHRLQLHRADSRRSSKAAGLPIQRIIGTGLPPWRVLDDDDVDEAVAALRRHGVRRMLLSSHDSCDVALAKLEARSGINMTVLSAGATYRL